VCYPDYQNFVLRFCNCILRYQIPVTGHKHIKGINTCFKKYLFNGSRAMMDDPPVMLRKDKYHVVLK